MRAVKVTSMLVCLLGLVPGRAPVWALDATAERDSYRIVTWSSLSDRNFSPLVQQVYDAEGRRWRHAESTRLIAHAASVGELANMVEEAHYAWREVGRQLSLPEPTRRARLVYIYETATWDKLGEQSGIRPDGLALQSGRDILLKVDRSQSNRLDRIAHELVHFRLREAYGNRLPLWLEEGLATLMGMNVARRFNSAQGRDLAGSWPALPAAALLESDELLKRDFYPSSPAAAQAYGRQAAEVVRMLQERIGPERWPMVVREIGHRGDWRSVLASGYDVDMNALNSMATIAADRAARVWNY